MPSSSPVWTIARKELGDGLRNRWIWAVTLLLAGASLAIGLFGAAPVGVAATEAGGAIMASLTNLAVYLVPLLALMLGSGAVIEEKRRGTLDLILSYPLHSRDYFLGSFAGFALALSLALTAGYLVAGLVLVPWAGLEIGEYLVLTGLSLLLGVVFLAIAFLVSLQARDRGKAIAASVFIWLGSVFLYDLVLVGILVLSEGEIPGGVLSGLLLLNPTDAFRILCLRVIESSASPLGLSTLSEFLPSTAALVGTLTAWALLPLFTGFRLFQSRVARDTLV